MRHHADNIQGPHITFHHSAICTHGVRPPPLYYLQGSDHASTSSLLALPGRPWSAGSGLLFCRRVLALRANEPALHYGGQRLVNDEDVRWDDKERGALEASAAEAENGGSEIRSRGIGRCVLSVLPIKLGGLFSV